MKKQEYLDLKKKHKKEFESKSALFLFLFLSDKRKETIYNV